MRDIGTLRQNLRMSQTAEMVLFQQQAWHYIDAGENVTSASESRPY
jgi:hypothetical protein